MNKTTLGLIFAAAVAASPLVAAPGGKPLLPEADPGWGKPLPWSRFARVESLPAMQRVANLDDGNPSTCAAWCTGAEGGGEISIRFPSPVDVTVFRFVQGYPSATRYRLSADLDGKGDFPVVVAERTDEKAIRGEAIAIPVNRKVHGLRFTALAGSATFRSPFPRLFEVQVFSREKAPSVPSAPRLKAPALKETGTKEMPPLTKREIDIRLCFDAWHAGLYGTNSVDAVEFEAGRGFQGMLKSFREADANSARFFIEGACCDDEMPWRSEKLWPGHGHDWLAPLCQALHKNGLKLYFFSHAWMSPFQKRGERAPMPYCRWDYPYEQSDRYFGLLSEYKVKYPCILCDPGFRDKWLALLDEAIGQGADGVYLMPDEYYFKGHNLAIADCPLCAAEFKKAYGHDSLPKAVTKATVGSAGATKAVGTVTIPDTRKYRDWKLFEYNKIAEVFHSVSAELRRRHPKTQIVMSDNKATEDLQGRVEHNMVLDIIENDPNADFSQMYGDVPVLGKVGCISAYVRRIAAAAGEEKLFGSIQWLGVWDQPTNEPIHLHGYELPQIMLGAKGCENYRLNYMYDKGWWPNTIECHKMVRLLEAWDVLKAKSPEVACLIESRASEDWWRTKMDGMRDGSKDSDVAFHLMYDPDEDKKTVAKASTDDRDRILRLDALRGVGAKQAMESFFCDNAIPYKVAFADRPDNMADLKRFKLLVMPFAYALSSNAFESVRAAVDAGSTLVVFGPLAPVDEHGDPHPAPLLASLLGRPNVIHVEDDLAAVGNSSLKRAEYAKLFAPILEPCGYGFDAGGKQVECIVRTLPGKKGYLVYLGNWDRQGPARVAVKLPALAGSPSVEVYDSASKTLTSARAKGWSFSLDVPATNVKLLRVLASK